MASYAKKIFQYTIQAVQPDQLIAANLILSKNTIYFDNQQHKLDNNVYIVGFGKAVGGMCHAVQKIVKGHIVEGALSMPFDLCKDLSFQKLQNLLPLNDGKVIVYEGAKNNLPDEMSAYAAKRIIQLCKGVTENDLVIALVSGGGSALLPAPIFPLTLPEKLSAITLLSGKGATIQELNTLRKNLSTVKGGQLAEITYPAKMWSFILSDIIGDPIDLIASGPTVPNGKNPQEAISIIEKYGLQDNLPKVYSLLKTMNKDSSTKKITENYKVINKIVGNNLLAVNAAAEAAKDLGFETVVLSKSLQGEARHLGALFARLSQHVFSSSTEKNNLESFFNDKFQTHGLKSEEAESACSKIVMALKKSMRLCIISGGESTVTLNSNHGIGGRNQEMVLSFAVELSCLRNLSLSNRSPLVTFLSGGTDGQDGPTSAAGAVFSSANLETFDLSLAKQSLQQHDSNTFFHKSDSLILTGLTGTNVMDIQVLLIEEIA